MLMSSLSAFPAPQSGVPLTHPVSRFLPSQSMFFSLSLLSNVISFYSSSQQYSPQLQCLWLTPTTLSCPSQPSFTIRPKRTLQSSTTLLHSVSLPDTELPCEHLPAHEPYPIRLLLAFPFLFFSSVFSKSLYAFWAASSPFLWNQLRWSLTFPYALGFFSPCFTSTSFSSYLISSTWLLIISTYNTAAPGTRVTHD